MEFNSNLTPKGCGPNQSSADDNTMDYIEPHTPWDSIWSPSAVAQSEHAELAEKVRIKMAESLLISGEYDRATQTLQEVTQPRGYLRRARYAYKLYRELVDSNQPAARVLLKIVTSLLARGVAAAPGDPVLLAEIQGELHAFLTQHPDNLWRDSSDDGSNRPFQSGGAHNNSGVGSARSSANTSIGDRRPSTKGIRPEHPEEEDSTQHRTQATSTESTDVTNKDGPVFMSRLETLTNSMTELHTAMTDLKQQMSSVIRMLAQQPHPRVINNFPPSQPQVMNRSEGSKILFDKMGTILRRFAGERDFVALDDQERRICVTFMNCPLNRRVYTLLYAYKNDGFLAQVLNSSVTVQVDLDKVNLDHLTWKINSVEYRLRFSPGTAYARLGYLNLLRIFETAGMKISKHDPDIVETPNASRIKEPTRPLSVPAVDKEIHDFFGRMPRQEMSDERPQPNNEIEPSVITDTHSTGVFDMKTKSNNLSGEETRRQSSARSIGAPHNSMSASDPGEASASAFPELLYPMTLLHSQSSAVGVASPWRGVKPMRFLFPVDSEYSRGPQNDQSKMTPPIDKFNQTTSSNATSKSENVEEKEGPITIIFCARANLYRFSRTSYGWMPYANDDLKVLRIKRTGSHYLVIPTNSGQLDSQVINSGFKLVKRESNREVRWTAQYSSSGTIKYQQFVARFETSNFAKRFANALDVCVKTSPKSNTPESGVGTAKLNQWICSSCYLRNPVSTLMCLACQSDPPRCEDFDSDACTNEADSNNVIGPNSNE